jgi:DNA mismatch repair protein MutL
MTALTGPARSIAVLPPDVAAKIAAGEVIERPASIVKELVENAIDAGAQRISVDIEGGGVTLIRVADDGHGLAAGDIATAFLRHATSKLRRPEDLVAVTTLGFRGEALPSIAAAAEVELASRAEGAPSGGRVLMRDGALRQQSGYGGSRGTAVLVRDLFEAQPARRKFLRSAASEAAQIATLVGLYAVAYPEVAFTLTTDRRRSLTTTGGGDRREAVARVYNSETATALLELQPHSGLDDGGVTVAGLVSPPELTRANRGYIHCFVNRRIVQPRRLAFAIEAAYESLLPVGRHPIALLDLRLTAGEVDVNVHPTKSEVRFLHDREVQAAVFHAVREHLSAFAAPRSFAQASGATPPPMPFWHALAPERPAAEMLRMTGMGHAAPTATEARPAPRPALPILRVVGQSGNLYIVAEGWDGMYLIDQHAAHERVLYEQILQRQQSGETQPQGMLTPFPVELTASQEAALVEYREGLQEHGFDLEAFGPRTYLIRTVPTLLRERDPGRALCDLLDDLAEGSGAAERPSLVTMTVACHAAVRAGKTLAMEEMRELLHQLERCELPRTCPHGRPTMVHLSNEALEREFRRR